MQNLGLEERQKLSELNRIKWLATLVLLLCFCVMVVALRLEDYHPVMAYVAAFAEAATVGGIADWYAVVALFRHPMGVPIPHTAIVPNNQHKIGDNIGRFIENNFLASEPVEKKLREVDFAEEIASWLSDREKSRSFADFTVRLIPQMLAAVDEKAISDFTYKRIKTQLENTNLAPLLGKMMDTIARDKRQQQLMNELISALHRFLNDEEALKAIQQKVHDELPALFNLFRADTLLMNRIVKAASALLDEVKEDPNHPLRAEFESFLKKYIRSLKRSKRFAKRVEAIKIQILERPEVADLAEQTWHGIRKLLEDDAKSDNPTLAARLTDLLVDTGRNLQREQRLKEEINNGMVTFLTAFVENQKSNISLFVADQVKGWDFQQLTLLIEANIGKDLQYIRFNGMLVGGFVGVALHVLQQTVL